MFYKKTVLDNGVTVLTEHMDAVRSAALGFWMRVGTRDESSQEAGMSHFMEHMLFKGTPTRSALDISTAFDALGADFNAFTTREYTCFYTRLIDERLPNGFEILADMLINSHFAPEDIATESKVVLEEISRNLDSPDDHVYDVFSDAVFPVNPLGRPILGTSESVSGFDTNDMHAYHDAHYTTGNLYVVACGNVDHDQVVELASKHLADMKVGERIKRSSVEDSSRQDIVAVKKDIEQAHIIYGMPTISFHNPNRLTYNILDIILGGGMSSRLFQEIREKRGLVYSVYASSQLYEDNGLFEMYAGTNPDNIAEVVEVARNEFSKAAEQGITQEELDRAKELACGGFVLGMEATRMHMTRIGRFSVLGIPIYSLDETLERYRSVTLDDVNDAARDLFTKDPTIAVVSSYDQDEVERMLK